ncbi:hypothetical protein P0136_08110 [Lentisphaerota bacterium ZTH]|nr:hypothetical protein JYG24_00780 [Lentisphaerota bacterium]WET05327.1 hypothetical protein P0136_08110 [Lentisphaerota bacterium ZTH]
MNKIMNASFIFVLFFMTGMTLRAEECVLCGNQCSIGDSKVTDSVEFELRKMYLEKIKEYIRSTHSELLKSDNIFDLDKLCELYNIPARKGVYQDDELFTLFSEVENQMQSRRLEGSIGDSLPYEKIRPDIKNTTLKLGLGQSDFEMLESDSNIDTITVCNECSLCESLFSYNFTDYSSAKTPLNIQLALKFDRIVNGSDVIILLGAGNVAQFFLDYLKLFSNKSFVLGIDFYDGSPDWSNPDLNAEITRLVHETIVKDCENFPADLSSLIIEYGFPVLSFEKYFPAKLHPNAVSSSTFFDHYDSVVSFLDARCPNAVCFGTATALTQLAHLVNYEKAIEDNYRLLEEASKELNIEAVSIDEAKTSKKTELQGYKFYAQMISTKVCRQKVADKVCHYFYAVNKGNNKKTPFILLLNGGYGLLRNPSTFHLEKYTTQQRQLLIQNLIKEKLHEMNVEDAKVTAIYVSTLGTRASRLFSKEENAFLNDFCLDYVMVVDRTDIR